MDGLTSRTAPAPPGALKDLCRRSDARGLAQLAGHLGLLAATGAFIALARGSLWLAPALLAHGVVLIFLFCPLHEAIHRTAFRRRWLNDGVAWLCGAPLLLAPSWFRAYHNAHHRFTQDPLRDPELARPKPASRGAWLWHVSGLPSWRANLLGLRRQAAGRVEGFVPPHARATVRREARALLLLYATVVAASLAAGSAAALLYWIVPALLGQPFLRLFLLAEHTGCPQVADMLANSRTTRSTAPLRRLTWNMPYHAEHHANPAIPFHALPRAHARLRARIVNQAPGYLAANRAIFRALR